MTYGIMEVYIFNSQGNESLFKSRNQKDVA